MKNITNFQTKVHRLDGDMEKEAVVWSYRLILGREPESESVVQRHLKNHATVESLREEFLESAEFNLARGKLRSRGGNQALSLGLPKNKIDYDATPKQLAQCVSKIREAWTHLGITSPHFSVLSDKQFLPENLEMNIDHFWESGQAEATLIQNMLHRHGLSSLSERTCIEYGCGVGRVTTALAQLFRRLVGYDISPGHLSNAKKRAESLAIKNCTFHLCADSFLEDLESCDVFYSRIVFQHNPPPVIYKLIGNALRSLKSGGIAIFQVPTMMMGYRFDLKEWLQTQHELDMQMHCLPQDVIFSLIAEQHCQLLEVREDNSTGDADRFISNMFVVQKTG